MNANIIIIFEDKSKHSFDFDQIPDMCPICNNGIEPIIYQGYYSEKPKFHSNITTQVLFQCPIDICQSLFIGYYFSNFLFDHKFRLVKIAPLEPNERKFDNIINDISPDFIEIYNQAFKSEQLGWIQVAGPGYRKSLEFLIKDYCCQKVDSDIEKENIRLLLLSNVINQYIDDARIKRTASRAAWLGNDETHYVRKWIDKDLQDLKRLIELTLNWISLVELSNLYEDEMPQK